MRPPAMRARISSNTADAAAVPRGWGVQPAAPAPFIWRWSWSKLKVVILGTLDASFTSWGRDLPSRYSQSGEVTKSYTTEVALLAALLLTITASYMMSPPDVHSESILIVYFGLSENDHDVWQDTFVAVWGVTTLTLLWCLLTAVVLIVLISMNTNVQDDKHGQRSAYLLARLGKMQKLPLQLFVVSILVGIMAIFVWMLMALHYLAFISIFATAVFVVCVIFFFVFPLVGALLDTIEAERANALTSMVEERSQTTPRNLSPDIKFKTRALRREQSKLSASRRNLGRNLGPQEV